MSPVPMDAKCLELLALALGMDSVPEEALHARGLSDEADHLRLRGLLREEWSVSDRNRYTDPLSGCALGESRELSYLLTDTGRACVESVMNFASALFEKTYRGPPDEDSGYSPDRDDRHLADGW